MRTNKDCPEYEKNDDHFPPLKVAMTKEEEDEFENEVEDENELVKIDGTKMQLSGRIFKVRFPTP
jgi:transcription initiation factor TFIID subunit 1